MEPISEEILTKVVIFCGGKGTRMWPISNVGHPKQFDAILGKTSFFRQTIERALKGYKAEDLLISTGIDFRSVIEEQAPEIPRENVILEPEMRDTLGAVALAAATVEKRFPNCVMVILWGADHLVKKEGKFIEALKRATRFAYKNNVIVHIDMKPAYPSVHNGWIKVGRELFSEGEFKVYEFLKQVEKPDLTTANKFFKSGQYLIHSGYMVCKPKLLLDFYKKYAPECFKIIDQIKEALGTPREKQVLSEKYPKIEKNSVDFGLFEKLPAGSQWELPVEIGWVDLGTWELLYNGLPKDNNGNVVVGRVEIIDSKNCLIFSRDKKIVGIIGLSDMIIIDTSEGLLVCSRNEASKVKQLYKNIFEKEKK